LEGPAAQRGAPGDRLAVRRGEASGSLAPAGAAIAAELLANGRRESHAVTICLGAKHFQAGKSPRATLAERFRARFRKLPKNLILRLQQDHADCRPPHASPRTA